MVQGRVKPLPHGLNSTESNLLGWMNVRESYSRALEQGTLMFPFILNINNMVSRLARSTPNLCAIHCSKEANCWHFHHENYSCYLAGQSGLVASSEVGMAVGGPLRTEGERPYRPLATRVLRVGKIWLFSI